MSPHRKGTYGLSNGITDHYNTELNINNALILRLCASFDRCVFIFGKYRLPSIRAPPVSDFETVCNFKIPKRRISTMSVHNNKIKIKKILGHKRWNEIEVEEGSVEHQEIIVWNKAMNYTINQDRKEVRKQNERAETEISSDALYDESGYEIPDVDSLSPSEFYMVNARNEELRKAIEQLTPRQQEMVRLVFWEGKTQHELCDIYHIKEQAVSNAMQRIYSALRKILEKDKNFFH